jgi:hypothetical protein
MNSGHFGMSSKELEDTGRFADLHFERDVPGAEGRHVSILKDILCDALDQGGLPDMHVAKHNYLGVRVRRSRVN